MTHEVNLQTSYNIPEVLQSKVFVSDGYKNYTASGIFSSYGVDLEFAELHIGKTLKSSDFYLLAGKVEDTLRSWAQKYERHLDREHKNRRDASVEDLNREAAQDLKNLSGILSHTLDVDDIVDWNAIRRKDAFCVVPGEIFEDGRSPEYIVFNSDGRPTGFRKLDPPREPVLQAVKDKYGLLSKLFRGGAIQRDFDRRCRRWRANIEQINAKNEQRSNRYVQARTSFDRMKQRFDNDKKRENDALENLKARYAEAEPRAVEEYCDLVLNASAYPDFFPKNWHMEYRAESRILVINYKLPAPDQLPVVESYNYVKSRDEVTEKKLSPAAQKKLYDSVIYQICIRTVHELFEADSVNALDAVVFNGLVTTTNPATGILETKTIISVSAEKQVFEQFDLAKVDPKATFRHLKGVSAASLVGLTPIQPVVQLDKTDKRIIEGRDVVHKIDSSVNLAAMDWNDFEHLIRELFEKEFSVSGGEVKVTQASSDGGVDAIAFDPDPIRGGKIVIQAKRYTNVVTVAAVRDLYGTVLNEGANKGILVTTSYYGTDSYEFAKGKPLTLLDGSNLLGMLDRHGHKARINIAEAKKILKG